VSKDRGLGLREWLTGPGRKESTIDPAKSATLDRHRLAVLPLSNVSSDPHDEYFADGLTDELISTTSAIGGLTVIARTSVMRYKGVSKGASEIGKELNAGSLLEGSVRKSGSKLRVAVQLIDAQTEGHVWSDSFDRELQDIFAVQTEIARQVAGSLALKLTDRGRDMIDGRRTARAEAYDFYLKGLYHFNQRTKDAVEKAVRFFELATEEDPNYALAYAGLADAYGILGIYGYASPSEVMEKGKEFASKALKLDDSLAEAHVALAMILWNQWDYVESGREVRAALKNNPNYARAHQQYGDYLFCIEHDSKQAMAEFMLARELDPLSPIANLNVAGGYYGMREYGKAIKELRNSLEMFPDYWNLHLYLSLSLAMTGDYEEALKEIEVAGRSSDRVWLLQGRGTVYGLWGKTDQAAREIEELKRLSEQVYVSPTVYAAVYAAMGDRDGAFKVLDNAFRERSPDLPGELLGHPFYADKLGIDQRWNKLLKKLGLKDPNVRKYP
jgi:TolB-like protein/tetratricopeptide (TPR) repeat protein